MTQYDGAGVLARPHLAQAVENLPSIPDGRIEQALAKLSMQTDTGLDGKAAQEPPTVAE